MAAAVAAFFLPPAASATTSAPVEVVVRLPAPSLADAVQASRVLTAHAKAGKVDLRSPYSADYLRRLAALQAAAVASIRRAVPEATFRWRYRIVLDAVAVVVPRDRLRRLSQLPGVAAVYPGGGSYHSLLDRSPELIGADQLWGADFSTAGQGEKIAILDQGIYQAHPFFDPAGLAYPPGFPKGDATYTTPKVIAARAFAPPHATWKYASLPYDPAQSDHGDHVAGIAAGDYTPDAVANRGPLSGVAPRAYLGNYKVLTIPTPDFGIDGNNPEIAAAIEAAVADGMDVLNLSVGEPGIDLASDVVARAIDGAARAGVVTTVAAGNDYDVLGRGSIESPGTAPAAITAAAASKASQVASFSSAGPSPIGLGFKPDVTAPGVSILSSLPPREGNWGTDSGTSMAAPHVAGAAALLRQRHPNWTVQQLKSALVLTGDPVYVDNAHTTEAATNREGGGMINLPRADNPLVFADPTGLSFGLLKPGARLARTIALTDAGGGVGGWAVSVQAQGSVAGLAVAAPPTVEVPGELQVTANVAANATETDATGFVVLQRGADRRRIPYWLRIERPKLAPAEMTLRQTGTYSGTTVGRSARVRSYRYPDDPSGSGISNDLRGPEAVYRVRLSRRVANFGVAIVSTGAVTPRVVRDDDENRLLGDPALPLDINPYLGSYGRPEPVAGAILPGRGTYDVVFDSRTRERAGRFTFRFWVNDASPPRVRLLTRSVPRGGTLRLDVFDTGSGVDADSFITSIDGRAVLVANTPLTRQATIAVPTRLGPGRHTLVLQVSDYQEEKNMEDVGPILPNTTTLRTTFTVAR